MDEIPPALIWLSPFNTVSLHENFSTSVIKASETQTVKKSYLHDKSKADYLFSSPIEVD